MMAPTVGLDADKAVGKRTFDAENLTATIGRLSANLAEVGFSVGSSKIELQLDDTGKWRL